MYTTYLKNFNQILVKFSSKRKNDFLAIFALIFQLIC